MRGGVLGNRRRRISVKREKPGETSQKNDKLSDLAVAGSHACRKN